MTFEEYWQSAPAKTRQELNQLFSNYGEPAVVLAELNAMPPCVQRKEIDVRINEKYFFWHRNKSFLRYSALVIYNTIHLYRLPQKMHRLCGQNTVIFQVYQVIY